MRAQSNTTEPYQRDQQYRTRDREYSPVTRSQCRQNKKSELPVEQSRSDGMAARKTVAGPIDERPINKWPMPMNKNLHPLVQQHPAGNGDDECDQRRPPFLPHKIQDDEK